MKERIKMLRKELGLTQQEFADGIGVKRNTVGQWECGINSLTDQTILSICREFDVNEEWLRNGTGEMFIKKSDTNEIAAMGRKVISENIEAFRTIFSAIAQAFDELSPESKEKIRKTTERIRIALDMPKEGD